MDRSVFALAALCVMFPIHAWAICPYDVNCLNNPYGGRNDNLPAFNGSPYRWGEAGAAFNANPLRYGSPSNPYTPSAPSDEEPAAPISGLAAGGFGPGASPPPDGMQGIDPDRPQ